jgi:hypothetical protein
MEGYGTSAVIYLKVRGTHAHMHTHKLTNSHTHTHKPHGPSLTTSCAVVIQALSSDSVERLPVFNQSALRHYQTTPEADDWCMPSKEPKKMGK